MKEAMTALRDKAAVYRCRATKRTIAPGVPKGRKAAIRAQRGNYSPRGP
jgi:hypothetical protein